MVAPIRSSLHVFCASLCELSYHCWYYGCDLLGLVTTWMGYCHVVFQSTTPDKWLKSRPKRQACSGYSTCRQAWQRTLYKSQRKSLYLPKLTLKRVVAWIGTISCNCWCSKGRIFLPNFWITGRNDRLISHSLGFLFLSNLMEGLHWI